MTTSRAPAFKATAFAVAVLAAIPFLPALGNGWVNWDDFPAIRDNARLNGFTLENLRWMLTTFHLGHYQPLAWISLGLDRFFWGPTPMGNHASAVLLHSGSAAVYFALARELLTAARPHDDERARLAASALAALAFAVHPLRVESVAWATERRDVLCELFSLLCILSYVRDRLRGGLGRDRRTLLFFIAALGSKVFAAALPGAMLALDFYPLKRLSRRSVLEKWPFFLLGALAVCLGLAAQASTPALLGFTEFGFASRLAQAAYATAFYPAKTVFPVGLAAWYGDFLTVPASEAAVGVAFFLVVSWSCWRLRRSHPALLASWAAYLALLSPASGLVKSAAQLVADRYSYLSCLPFPLLAAGGALALPRRRALAALAGVLLVFGLGAATWSQTLYWRDSVTLWSRACAVNPLSPFPRTSLILAFLEVDRPDLALEHLNLLAQRPANDGSSYNGLAARVLNNAGVQLAGQGRLEDAEASLERSLQLEPALEESRRNLAAVRAALAARPRRRRR